MAEPTKKPDTVYTIRILEPSDASLGSAVWGGAYDSQGAHQLLGAFFQEADGIAQGRCIVLLDDTGKIIAYLGEYPQTGG